MGGSLLRTQVLPSSRHALDPALADACAAHNAATVVIAAHRATQRTHADLPQRQSLK